MNDNLSTSDFELTVDNDSRRYLYSTANWGKFLAIAGLICAALLIVFGVYTANEAAPRTNRVFMTEEEKKAFTIGYMIVYIVAGLLIIFPCIMLFRFATKIKTALASNNQEMFAQGLRAQKNLYIFQGILVILMLVFLLLGIAGLAAGGAKN